MRFAANKKKQRQVNKNKKQKQNKQNGGVEFHTYYIYHLLTSFQMAT